MLFQFKRALGTLWWALTCQLVVAQPPQLAATSPENLLLLAEELPDSSALISTYATKARDLALKGKDDILTSRAIHLLGRHQLATDRTQEGISHLEQSVRIIQQQPHQADLRPFKTQAIQALASAYFYHMPDSVNSFLATTLNQAASLTDSLFIADLRNTSGTFSYQFGDYHNAIFHYEEAARLYRGEKSLGELSKVLFNLGLLYKRMGKFDDSLIALLEASEHLNRDGFGLAYAKCLNAIGSVYRALEDPERALEYQSEALQLFRKLPDSLHIAVALNSMGLTYHELGKPAAGLRLLKQSLLMKQRLGLLKAVSATLHNIGFVYLSSNPDSARPYFQRSELLKKQVQDRYGLASLYNDMAQLTAVRKDPENTERFLGMARQLALELNAHEVLLENYEVSKTVAIENADYRSALYFSEMHDSLSRIIYQVETRKETELLEARFQNRQKKQAILLKDARLKLQGETLEQERWLRYFLTAAIGLAALVIGGLLFFFRQRQKIQKAEGEQKAAVAELIGEEQERMRVAEVLHDEVAGQLSGISTILQHQTKGQPEDSPLKKVAQSLAAVYQTTRLTSNQLAPYQLLGKTLVEGLLDHFESINETGNLRVDFNVLSGFHAVKLQPEIEIQLYRSAQELTTNVLRHASADKMWIELGANAREVYLKVVDDGVGFTSNLRDGLGLSNLRRRINYLNGKLELQSESGTGTEVSIWLPTLFESNKS